MRAENTSLSNIYQQQILQHNRAPAAYRQQLTGDWRARGYNPLCGDELELEVQLSADLRRITGLHFSGASCAICTASASLLCQQLHDLDVSRARACADQLQAFIEQGMPLQDEVMQVMTIFSELHKLPNRKSCATLPWTTLQSLVEQISNHLTAQQSKPARG